MIISRTPLRISFAGGGTDLPGFYRAHGGGAVTSAAIDQYITVVVTRKFDPSIHVAYSKLEKVHDLAELEHGLVREAMRATGLHEALEIHTIADIPSEGSGLGSSSTLTVGLLNALHHFQGRDRTPEELAQEACRIEIEKLSGTLGKQDQYIAAYGGLRHFEFRPDDTVKVTPIPLAPGELAELAAHFSLFYTGVTRQAQGILKGMDRRTSENVGSLVTMRGLAARSRDALLARDFPALGRLLDEGWELKRGLSEGISNPQIDQAYSAVKSAGAYGGKITGAGGGGFFLVAHPPGRSREIASAVSGMRRVPFSVSPNGSQILKEPT